MKETLLKYPRTLNLVVFVFSPLFLLIGFCFVCGYFVALIEKPGEIESNDALFRDYYHRLVMEVDVKEDFTQAYQSLTDECLDLYPSSTASSTDETSIMFAGIEYNATDLQGYMSGCINSGLKDLELPSNSETNFDFLDDLAYHWIRCPKPAALSSEDVDPVTVSLQSAWYYFDKAFNKLIEEANLDSGFSLEIYEEGMKTLTGHEECRINASGGAFFWFTVMTTIGYGNVTPVTEAGRSLVYTLGFLSILLFTAVSGNAGYVTLVLADGGFRKKKLNFLTKGFGACVFWLALYYLWNCVVASFILSWAHRRTNFDSPYRLLKNMYWYAYASTTTIGFGDYYPPHSIIFPGDLFYISLVMLMGFVLLANFLIKFAEWMGELSANKEWMFHIQDLEEQLERKSDHAESADSGNIDPEKI